jgi:hypothetical protein
MSCCTYAHSSQWYGCKALPEKFSVSLQEAANTRVRCGIQESTRLLSKFIPLGSDGPDEHEKPEERGVHPKDL